MNNDQAMRTLFSNNRKWSLRMRRSNPRYFQRLSRIQKPAFLWIGCSDSRVPANEIIGLLPGELFVHRNIANIVYGNDLNCSSVVHYAVEVLKVRHIIVCGHYNCGGVRAVVMSRKLGRMGAWLSDIRETMRRHAPELKRCKTKTEKINRLCELNVLRQAGNVGRLYSVRRALKRRQPVTIHAWIYDLRDGLLKELARSGTIF